MQLEIFMGSQAPMAPMLPTPLVHKLYNLKPCVYQYYWDSYH